MNNIDKNKMISLRDYKGIYGAVIGDVVGSHYEFQHGPKLDIDKVKFFYIDSRCTDDTTCTVAIADYLFVNKDNESPTKVLQKWCREFDYDFGGRFYTWVHSDNPQPNHSYGNGSAMRVSSVAYKAKSEEEVKKLSKEVTEISHNHIEGLKGAEVEAMCIYKALHGASKDDIREYASKYYDLNLDYDYMRSYLGHGEEICQVTVPQAIWCFLHSNSFEECIRLCMAIRWDADTLGAIAGAIAEAYYKEIPEWILIETKKRLPEQFIDILDSVEKVY